jgi:prolyl-tRNA synthetase
VKFKDADLIGIPYRINVGRGVSEGKVELVDRLNRYTQEIALEQIVAVVADQITTALQPLLPAATVKAS